MAIQVVRFEHQSWRRRVPDAEEDEPSFEADQAILLFDPRLERGAESVIGDRFRRLDAGLRAADLLVIRGSEPTLKVQVDEDEMLERLRRGRDTLVLAPEAEGEEPVLQPVEWSGEVTRPPEVAALREAEILCGLSTEQAIYRERGVHYLMPNTRYHAAAFVRLGDSLNDQIDLFRLSDWLIGRVDERTALLADNGSMLALLTTLALRLQRIHGWSPQIATLDEYPVTPTAIATLVDRLRVAGEERLLCAVSVSSSGQVARTVAELAEIETEAVILCETGDPTDDGIDRFAIYPVDRWKIETGGRCERCEELHLLAVSPRSYELRTALKLKPESLDIGHASGCRDFWLAAQEADAVSLHVDARLAAGSAAESRHLAVQIDVTALLEKSASFRERCVEALRKIAEPDLVMIPEHGASAALAGLVGEAFSDLTEDRVKVTPVGLELGPLEPSLEGVEHVLIVDDTLVSGSTLLGLRLAVHRAAVELDRRIDVTIFVPLSRPSDPEDQRRVKRSVLRRDRPAREPAVGNLHFVQELLLPEACPWCEEGAKLTERLDSLVGESHEFGSGREQGIRPRPLTPPLLPLDEEVEGKIVGSFFGDLEPVPAFAAVSAHGQHLHDRMEQIRVDETIKVLDLPLLLQAFFDPIIVAGLLRTLPRRDLRDPAAEHLVAREIETNARSYHHATIAELAYAALESKLPAAPVRKALEQVDAPWARAYLDLLAGY